MHNNDEIL